MSADDNGPGRREVARRVFAAEYDDADLSYSESEEERAPNYVVVPTGARVNRLFLVGVLTEVETVNENVLRGRVVDPTGAFVVYAGQYQPEAVAALERADPPAFVSVTGKARTFEPEDSNQVYASVRPESINHVDTDTRDGWTVRTAEHTLARVAAFADALDRPERGEDLQVALEAEGVAPALAAGIPRAIDHYGTTRTYLSAVRDLAVDAARVVAGEREEVTPLEVAPGEGDGADVDVSFPGTGPVLVGQDGASPSTPEPTSTAESDAVAESGSDVDSIEQGTDTPSETDTESREEPAEAATETGGDTAVDTSAETETDTADEPATETGSAGDGEAAEPPAEDEMYELDEDERAEVESEFGTEFTSGEEIPEAGEADIETPAPEETAVDEEVGAAAGGVDTEDETPGVEETEAGAETPEPVSPEQSAGETDAVPDADDGVAEPTDAVTTDDAADESGEPPSGDDLEDAVVEEMRALDDGGGADREELVERVVAEHGVEASAVEDAIQEALMGGRCYESGDDALTPI